VHGYELTLFLPGITDVFVSKNSGRSRYSNYERGQIEAMNDGYEQALILQRQLSSIGIQIDVERADVNALKAEKEKIESRLKRHKN
jgi:hypothetical protein